MDWGRGVSGRPSCAAACSTVVVAAADALFRSVSRRGERRQAGPTMTARTCERLSSRAMFSENSFFFFSFPLFWNAYGDRGGRQPIFCFKRKRDKKPKDSKDTTVSRVGQVLWRQPNSVERESRTLISPRLLGRAGKNVRWLCDEPPPRTVRAVETSFAKIVSCWKYVCCRTFSLLPTITCALQKVGFHH